MAILDERPGLLLRLSRARKSAIEPFGEERMK
jgi:hypothetical protein